MLVRWRARWNVICSIYVAVFVSFEFIMRWIFSVIWSRVVYEMSVCVTYPMFQYYHQYFFVTDAINFPRSHATPPKAFFICSFANCYYTTAQRQTSSFHGGPRHLLGTRPTPQSNCTWRQIHMLVGKDFTTALATTWGNSVCVNTLLITATTKAVDPSSWRKRIRSDIYLSLALITWRIFSFVMILPE